jgi:hypothetical protein
MSTVDVLRQCAEEALRQAVQATATASATGGSAVAQATGRNGNGSFITRGPANATANSTAMLGGTANATATATGGNVSNAPPTNDRNSRRLMSLVLRPMTTL